MAAYYNEFEPYAAQWLRNLIAKNLICAGDVDERSIASVGADEIKEYTQCHFFAGIGVWSHALRHAGWDDSTPVWTGSCPCQPFSAAGKQLGTSDERHLWPEFHRLIAECQPPVVLGEQVASTLGRNWLDAVRADLEALGYAVGAADLGAACVGAPHIRQRLWWVADASGTRTGRDTGAALSAEARLRGEGHPDGCNGGHAPVPIGAVCRLADADHQQRRQFRDRVPGNSAEGGRPEGVGQQFSGDSLCGAVCRWADAARVGEQVCVEEAQHEDGRHAPVCGGSRAERPSPLHGFWRDADWLLCRDGKWRAVEPGTFPLAHGAPARVGRLRAYGNAIVPQVAAEVISAFMECRP